MGRGGNWKIRQKGWERRENDKAIFKRFLLDELEKNYLDFQFYWKYLSLRYYFVTYHLKLS